MMKDVLAVVPTRGLIFAETIKSLLRNGIDNPIIIEGLPIPDAQNEAVRQAMEKYIPYILFVEDDMSFPDHTVERMKQMAQPIVAADYPVDNGSPTIFRYKEEIKWCGLGCTLINRGVFTNMPQPWFDTSYSWKINSEDPLDLERIENPYKYGGHDINFFIKAAQHGFSISELPDAGVKHLRCSHLQRGIYNEGQFTITALKFKEKEKVSK